MLKPTVDLKKTIVATVALSLGICLTAGSISSAQSSSGCPISGVSSHLTVMADEAMKSAQNVELTIDEIYEDLKVKEVSYTRYPTTILNIRKYPTTDAEVLGKYVLTSEVKVIGELEDTNWVQIAYKDDKAYIHADYLTDKKPVQEVKQSATSTYNTAWSGQKLTRRAGTIQGPSGKETYYNLNMSGVVRIMRRIGINDAYWVRSDGVKMLGNYVMVAADLNIRPRGSLVQTSLGMGRVCDTGTFIYSNRTQLDIATAW